MLAVPLLDERVLDFVEGWDPGPRADPLVAAVVLFGPPSVVLATVTPIAVRIASRELHLVGRTAGRLFSVSTAGSIAGTFATAFWLVPAIGVDQLIAVGAVALLLAALPLALADRAWALAGTGAALAVVAAATAVAVAPDSGGTVSASRLRNALATPSILDFSSRAVLRAASSSSASRALRPCAFSSCSTR